jgi:hypothetical protein
MPRVESSASRLVSGWVACSAQECLGAPFECHPGGVSGALGFPGVTNVGGGG